LAENAGEVAQFLAEIVEEETRGLDDIGKRIVANRLGAIIAPWQKLSDDREVVRRAGPPMPRGLTPMHPAEVESFSNRRITFGKHAGQRYRDIPLDYLRYMADLCRRTWQDYTRYLASASIRREEQQTHTTEVDELEEELVSQYYPQGECPDCGEDIPADAVAGQACKNCGHVFWPERSTDD
jgi:hypothetical protein